MGGAGTAPTLRRVVRQVSSVDWNSWYPWPHGSAAACQSFIDGTFWKLLVASGRPSDRALLCTLKVGIDHLIQNFFMTIPLSHPVPFKEMDQYSILDIGNESFSICSRILYTSSLMIQRTMIFFYPSILHALICKVEALPY